MNFETPYEQYLIWVLFIGLVTHRLLTQSHRLRCDFQIKKHDFLSLFRSKRPKTTSDPLNLLPLSRLPVLNPSNFLTGSFMIGRCWMKWSWSMNKEATFQSWLRVLLSTQSTQNTSSSILSSHKKVMFLLQFPSRIYSTMKVGHGELSSSPSPGTDSRFRQCRLRKCFDYLYS